MKRKTKKNSPIWPYLGILACLFLLSLTAPRAWDRHARRESLVPVSPLASRAAPKHDIRSITPEAVHLESPDATELEPHAGELDLLDLRPPRWEAVEPTLATLPDPPVMIPPAPEYAELVEEETPNPAVEQDEAIEAAIEESLADSQTDPPVAEPQFETAPADLPAEVVQDPEVAEVPVAESEGPDDSDSLADGEASLIERVEQVAEQESLVAETPAAGSPVWQAPRTLIEQLTNLAHEDSQLVWPRRAIQLIQELCRERESGSRLHTLTLLQELNDKDAQLPAADATLGPQITRVRYSLARWLDVWRAAVDLQAIPVEQRTASVSNDKIETELEEFETLAQRNSAGAPWLDYLQLDRIRQALSEDTSQSERREAARMVLQRLNSPHLSPAQRQFASSGPLAELGERLKTWAAEPADLDPLLGHLEQFEYSGLPSDAEIVAADFQNLGWNEGEQAAKLGRHLDTHYRNANVRIAISSELANRLVPQPGRINSAVRDTVVNVPVRGNSSTFTELSVRFVPDPKRIRIGLEANGTVDASTVSSAGPATFRNKGKSTFLLRKLFVLGPQGLHVWPAIAEAENNYNYLVSLETEYDGVPLVGSLVRNIALSQHDEMSGMARRETEMKVATRALRQLDGEVDTRLLTAGKKFEENQSATLQRLGLELVPISLQTTEQRIVGRVRLASPNQLGAHTARPRAPSDSWFSMQVHQSALNNAIEQLDFEGRTFELPELFAWTATKLGQPDLAQQEELPEDVQITFADRDAIRLECADNRIEVTFSIAELRHAGSRWRNFQVNTYYAPEAQGLSPRLARVGTIYLDGESLRGKIEFKLRAIFSKVLSKNRDLRLLADSITTDPRLSELQMTQFVIEDGWIALAYSPRLVSSNVARKPAK